MSERVARLALSQTRAFALSLLVSLAAAAPAHAAELPRQGITLAGITEYRLANGLQILLFPDAAKPTTTVNITYKVGSRHENVGETGMAHLLEHMLFKGTPEFRDIPGAYSQRGMRWNGSTTTDRTNYFSSFNASDDTLEFALKLEASRMLKSYVAKADLDKEMPVVRNEMERGENNAGQMLQARMLGTAYAFHPYGRPTIGARSDVENVDITRLRAFYRQHYQPDNAVLMVAGRFSEAQVLRWVARYFAPLPKPARSLPRTYTAEPAQDGERSVTLRRVGGAPMLAAVYHVPAFAHADSAALMVLGQMLSQEPSGPLYQRLVEGKLATDIWAGGAGGFDPGTFNVGMMLADGADLQAAEKGLLAVVEKSEALDLSMEAVQRVKDQMALGYREILKSPESAIGLLSEAIAAGDWRLIFQLLEDARSVTPDDLKRVAQTYLRPANRTLGRYLPAATSQKVAVPAVQDRLARLADLRIDKTLSAGETFEPTPQKLEGRTRRQQLPSGIKLATLNKQNRGDAVTLQMQLHWGDLPVAGPLPGNGFVAAMLFEGTQTRSRQDILDELVKLRAGLTIKDGAQGATIQLRAERDTLLPALALVADLLQHPAWPAEAFERIRAQAVSNLKSAADEPETLRQEAVREHYNLAFGATPGHPRYLASVAERLAKAQALSLAQVQAIHAGYWSANEAEVAVVGTVPAGLETAIDTLFGVWKNPEAPKYVRWINRYQDVAPMRLDVQAPDKANAVVRAQQELRLSARDEDYEAMLLADHILGGGGLESRLSTRVRQKEGLSYGISSDMQAPYWNTAGRWVITASTAPENRDRLIAVLQDELRRAHDQGFTQAELDRARHDILEDWRQQRSADDTITGQLLWHFTGKQDFSELARDETKLKAVTVADANAAFRRHIRLDGFVISSAGDFAAKPQAAKTAMHAQP